MKDPYCHPPLQMPLNSQFPPALAQTGEVSAPEYPVLQAADVQLPATEFVAVPVQLYPVGDWQGAAEGMKRMYGE